MIMCETVRGIREHQNLIMRHFLDVLYTSTHMEQKCQFVGLFVFPRREAQEGAILKLCRSNSGAQLPGSESQLCYILAVWPWASYLTSLRLSFLICKTEIIIITPTPEGCHEEEKSIYKVLRIVSGVSYMLYKCLLPALC